MLLQVLAGPDERDRNSLPADSTDYLAACDLGVKQGLKGLKVAWSGTLGYASVEPEVLELTKKAAQRFTELGAEVEEADPGFAAPTSFFNVFFYAGIIATLRNYLPEKADLLDPGLRQMAERVQNLSGRDYGQALIDRQNFWDVVRRFFSKYDLLLTPTLPQPAFELGIISPANLAGKSIEGLDWTPFTYPFNLTGQPASSVPCGFTSDGLPVGLQIVGRRFADALVLQASAAFENLQPWAQYRPKLD